MVQRLHRGGFLRLHMQHSQHRAPTQKATKTRAIRTINLMAGQVTRKQSNGAGYFKMRSPSWSHITEESEAPEVFTLHRWPWRRRSTTEAGPGRNRVLVLFPGRGFALPCEMRKTPPEVSISASGII